MNFGPATIAMTMARMPESKDLNHVSSPASTLDRRCRGECPATVSRPMEREPLTSTQSPGRSASWTTGRPSEGFGAQRRTATPAAPSR